MKKIIVGIHSIINSFILCLMLIGPVQAQTASILPPAKTSFYDLNGNPVSSGTVEFFVPGQSAHKTTWQDSAETVPNQNPLTLDAAGRAIIWGDGAYRQVVKDSNNNLIWDAVTSSPGGGGGTVGAIGDSNSVGAIVPWSGFTIPAQYLYAAGQAVSRTGFPTLYSLLTKTEAVTCTGGNPTLTSLTDTSQLNVGAVVEALCVSANTTIISKTATSVTLSSNAVVSISTNAIFYPYGNGDGLTTFNLPDYRGVVLPGRNNMNGVASANLTTSFYTDPNALFGGGGSQSGTLVTANLPPYTPAGNIGTNITGGSGPQGLQNGTGGSVNIGGTGSGGTNVALAANSSFTGTPQGGTSIPFSKIAPSRTVDYIIKALPNPVITAVVCANLQDAGTACTANVGTSGHVVPFLDGTNTFSGTDIFNNGITIGSKAAALVGNATSTAGPDVDFTIQGLAAKTVPDANNDLLLLWDNAANSFKKVTPGQVGSSGASGVSSLDAVTGPITTQSGSLKVVGTQLSSNILSSRAFAITQNLSAFTSIQTLGYASAGDGGGANFVNIGTGNFRDTYITGATLVGGSGYPNGTGLGVTFTGGTGGNNCEGAANAVSGVITGISLVVPCSGYKVGDVLSASYPSGPTGTGFSYTVTSISTPQASFTDAVGNHWQFMPNGTANILQFGAVPNWANHDSGATNNSPAIWSANAWGSYIGVFNGVAQSFGTPVYFPRGSYMTCGQVNFSTGNIPYYIPISQNVRFIGDGPNSTTLAECAADTAANHYIELCNSNALTGEFGCGVESMTLYLQQQTAPTAGIAAIYSNSGQQFPLGVKLFIQPGNTRGCIKYETGKGGAANAIFYNIDCAASGAASNNPMVLINSPSTQFILRDSVIENGGAGSIGIDLLSGRLAVDGLDVETFAIGLNMANATSGNLSVYRNVQQNSNSCSEAVSLTSTNVPGNIMFENLATTCPITILNGQSGGANFTGSILKPLTCVSGACT